MKCHRCPNLGTILRTELINGEIQQYFCCAECARKEGLVSDATFSKTEIFPEQQLEFNLLSTKTSTIEEIHTTCSICKLTWDEFNKSLELGCPHCYDVFQQDLDERILSVQEEKIHQGEKPHEPTESVTKLTVDIDELKTRLEKAIEANDQEEAYRLIHFIKSLEDAK